MIRLFACSPVRRAGTCGHAKKIADPLALLLQQIDFAAIARTVDAQLSLGTGRRGGCLAWSTVLIIKLLLLQQ